MGSAGQDTIAHLNKRPPPHVGNFLRWVALAQDDETRLRRAAWTILDAFDAYYLESRSIPQHAKAAFEDRDASRSLYLSRRRLTIYSESVRQLAARLTAVVPELAEDEALWRAIEGFYLPEVSNRYESDLAAAYIHSLRRLAYGDETWKPVEYALGWQSPVIDDTGSHIVRRFGGRECFCAELAGDILMIPAFAAEFSDFERDCQAIASRVNERLGLGDKRTITQLEVLNAGFYRNRGAYIVGRIALSNGHSGPLILALDTSDDGIFVDAVLLDEKDVHNIFSSTLANFHVTNSRYHELSRFLHSLMPARPLGLHYSTIGFNHIGKVAVMDELRSEIFRNAEVFGAAPGSRGSVAIGFTTPSSGYVLKVVRDQPTEHYKWESFPGVDAVIAKYRRVHEINRTGSMLDNMIFQKVDLDAEWFADDLRDELLSEAGQAVAIKDGRLAFNHLIVQPKLVPLTVFLETAEYHEATAAVINLGHCIKNNAAANIFNRDLDARNYGVSHTGKVFLFDYDALEPLTEIKVRTNADRFEGEEDVPDWYFEEGHIFLPEEIEAGFGIDDRGLRRDFRANHGELLQAQFWLEMQDRLRRGDVPRISIYLQEDRLISMPERT